MVALPLAGTTVVALERAVAAPISSCQLAGLGARVIKIQRPKAGDFARAYDQSVNGQSAYFILIIRSKESLTLDVKYPKTQEVLGKLITGTDVFIQNLVRPAQQSGRAWG